MSSLTVTLIQSDMHWEDKAANISMFTDKINSIEEKTEIIILPEMFTTGFSMQPEKFAEEMNGQTLQWLKNVSAQKKAIITGSFIIKEKGQYFNRLIWMLPDGNLGLYDKRHLFAYADEEKHYVAGSKRLIASVKGWRINLQICYDLRFPVWSRQQIKDEPEFDVLVYVANWPERRSNAWKTLLQARAIENQCYVIGVNRVGMDGKENYHSGDSMVVSPLGDLLYHNYNEEHIATITLHKHELDTVRTKLPFWKDADPFAILH